MSTDYHRYSSICIPYQYDATTINVCFNLKILCVFRFRFWLHKNLIKFGSGWVLSSNILKVFGSSITVLFGTYSHIHHANKDKKTTQHTKSVQLLILVCICMVQERTTISIADQEIPSPITPLPPWPSPARDRFQRHRVQRRRDRQTRAPSTTER